MSRFSNSFSISIVSPGTSVLATLAASMSPNTFAAVPSPGGMVNGFFNCYDPATIPSGIGYDTNALTYTSRACYDNVHGKIYLTNGTHGADALDRLGPGLGFFWTYTLATNSWTKVDRIAVYPNLTSVFHGSHAYEHMTVNPATGTLYYRAFGSGGLTYTLAYNTSPVETNWGTVPANYYSANIGGTIDYWQSLNGGAGGLIIAGEVNIQATNAAITSWTTPAAPPNDVGPYQQWGAVTDNFYYWGKNLACRRIAPTMGATSRIADLPYNAGVAALGGAMVRGHPNGTDLILFPYQLAGDIYVYRQATDTWNYIRTVVAGQAPFNSVVTESPLSATTCVSCTLKDLGVILIIHCNGANPSTGQTMTLYKPPI